MKPAIWVLGLLIAFSMNVTANQTPEPAPAQKETVISVSDIYIQKSRGFNEPHELLLTGIFPNGCYKWLRADVKHVTDHQHEVRALAKVTQGMCIMVLVPFTKEVDLGVLKRGTHTVKVINGDGTTLEKQFEL
jgi:hypothetical protein